MEDPYRQSTPREDVINTRLDGLEENIVGGHMWRGVCFAFVVLFLSAVTAAAAVAVRAKDSATCHGEVKIDFGVATLRCSHKDHKMTLVEHSEKQVIVSCVCTER